MFDFDTMPSGSPLDDVGADTGMDCEAAPGVDMHLSTGSHSVSFGRTGDVSFDDLMDRVDQFNAETRQLTELARQEIAAKTSAQMTTPIASSTYTYNTGDAQLDNLLNEAYREMSEYRTQTDQVRMELGPGKYLSIDDAINQGGSQGLTDYIQQRLDWMERATPEQLRQYEHQVNWQHEVEMARLHEHEVLQEQGDLMEQFIKHQTKEQFDAERAGYHQVNPWSPYRLYTGDPNIFEKDGELYRLIPGTGGTMERIDA